MLGVGARLLEHRAPLAVLRGRDEADLGAGEPVEQDVAAELEGRRASALGIGHAEEKDRAQPHARAHEGGRARVVRLEAAARDDDAGAARLRVGEQELELADLVARLRARGRVVALHPHRRADEVVERGETQDGRRAVDQEETREARLRCRAPALMRA